MSHKCYISFKTEDKEFKRIILEELKIDMVDKSLNEAINSDNEDYIMQVIRRDYLSDSTVTIHFISSFSAGSRGDYEQRFIKRELQASLYNGKINSRNGILGIVLPDVYDLIFKGLITCSKCGNSHDWVNISDLTTIKEFSSNYYIPQNKCAWEEDERYCVLVKWDDFVLNPEKFIDQAFDKRDKQIANKITVYP